MDTKKIKRALLKEKENSFSTFLAIIACVMAIIVIFLFAFGHYNKTLSEVYADGNKLYNITKIVLLVGCGLILLSKVTSNYAQAIYNNKYIIREINNVKFDTYSGKTYVTGKDEKRVEYKGCLCRSCKALLKSGNYQKVYYVEINAKKVYTKIVLV